MVSPQTSRPTAFDAHLVGPPVVPSPRWVRVKFGGEFVADSKRALLLRQYGPGRLPTYYFPQADVRMDLLEPTETPTRCPYKGVASYWSVETGGERVEDLVWYYPEPILEAAKIKGHLAFFNEKVDLEVDGEKQERPQTQWS